MQLRIKGYTFILTEPWAEGQVLDSATAKVLNDLRGENIGNNLRRMVKDAQARAGHGELIAQEVLDQLQTDIAQYDAEYQFKLKPSGAKLGDIEAECRVVAAERVQVASRFNGVELTEEELEAQIDLNAGLPTVVEEARARVLARRRTSAETLADL